MSRLENDKIRKAERAILGLTSFRGPLCSAAGACARGSWPAHACETTRLCYPWITAPARDAFSRRVLAPERARHSTVGARPDVGNNNASSGVVHSFSWCESGVWPGLTGRCSADLDRIQFLWLGTWVQTRVAFPGDGKLDLVLGLPLGGCAFDDDR